MPDQIKIKSQYQFYSLTKERWNDFTELFGEKGGCAGCWCMYWRVRRKLYEQNKGDGNKRAIKKIVTSGTIPGILAYKNSNRLDGVLLHQEMISLCLKIHEC